MVKAKKQSRLVLTIATVLLIIGALLIAFWPKPVMVDIGTVQIGNMTLTIDEEGRTRVRDSYIVSTPVAGQLQRVSVKPGDRLVSNETIVAHMRPTNPAALDVRTREQAQAVVNAAQAALRVARADLNAALAINELAQTDLSRTEQLVERGISSAAAMDSALQRARVSQATVDTAKAAISMRVAEIANAQTQLMGFDDQSLAAAVGHSSDDIPIYTPAGGRVLRVFQQSETTLPAGAPIMEIGNIESDLEIVVDLLSTDAVKVSEADRVIISDWGGASELEGEVVRVDPFGFTQFSALGVEEQRVTTVIALTSPPSRYSGLGHGFRVEAQIVVWEGKDIVIVPSSALFRQQENWAVFVMADGKAQLRSVKIGANNGLQAQVIDGLNDQESVVLYPASGIIDGVSVEKRETN